MTKSPSAGSDTLDWISYFAAACVLYNLCCICICSCLLIKRGCVTQNFWGTHYNSCMQDTTSPKLGFNATLPESGTASPMASLSWAADDMSPVTYQCQLSTTGASSGNLQAPVHALLPIGPLPGLVVPLGSWADCAPPLQLYWLLPGNNKPLLKLLHLLAELILYFAEFPWTSAQD